MICHDRGHQREGKKIYIFFLISQTILYEYKLKNYFLLFSISFSLREINSNKISIIPKESLKESIITIKLDLLSKFNVPKKQQNN